MNVLWREVEASMRSHPLRPALLDLNGYRVTYKKLLTNCDQISGRIGELLEEKAPLGLLSGKSIDTVSLLLACLRQNRTYIPLDVLSPVSRLKSIIGGSKLPMLYLDVEAHKKFEGFLSSEGYDLLPCSEPLVGYWALNRALNSLIQQEAAYVLYTSGSTGEPKGVAISAHQAYVFAHWAIEEFKIRPDDVLSSIAPLHFDLSIFDIYSGLLAGASVVLFDQKAIKNPRLLTQIISQEKVSVVYTTPTLLKLALGFGKWKKYASEKLRLILSAGEVLRPTLARDLFGLKREIELYNLYGPTETNVITYQKVTARMVEGNNPVPEIPIGQACPYVELRLTDRKTLQAIGGSVALGYVGEQGGFSEVDGKRSFDTGDVVELTNENEYLFKGRLDRMVKSRGNRIDLGEVEQAVLKLKEVAEVVVEQYTFNDGEILVAFIIPVQIEIREKPTHVKSQLSEWLPLYMIPEKIVYLNEIPMTAHHKIDIEQLRTLVLDL